MLITPVQPHNSLNNVLIRSRTGNDPAAYSHKIQDIKNARKLPISKPRKTPPETTRSLDMMKKKPPSEKEPIRKTPAHKSQSIGDPEDVEKKQFLANILREYEQISKDKNVLTAEIKNMKLYLSEIRSKLDQSLTVLNRNTSLFAKKSGISKSQLAPKSGQSKKIRSKKRKSKTENQKKPKSSSERKELFLNKESFFSPLP